MCIMGYALQVYDQMCYTQKMWNGKPMKEIVKVDEYKCN